MSVFRNIRIFPNHGSRSATLTWEIESADDVSDGSVYVAFSNSGTKGSWKTVSDAIPPATEMFMDENLIISSSSLDGYYRLLLVTDLEDYKSEPIKITGDITPREYGILRGIIHREFTEMRVTNGFPVWHCIPREHGVIAPNYDEVTGEVNPSCPEDPALDSFGMQYVGGYYPPVLTWIRPTGFQQSLKTDAMDLSPVEFDVTTVRMMAFPRPRIDHMIIDPANDRRYIIQGDVKTLPLRGVYPVAYEASMIHLKTSDPRYRFLPPFVDTKEYRRMKYWTPAV